jgi:hypothetical protein
MIPKIIHYCWFGGRPLPPDALKCIASWKKYLPEYEVRLWDESSFDVNMTLFTSQAYNAKKYAYVTDFVRLYALYNHGGIYMDTDVEVLKNLDPFLHHEAFSGFEDNCNVPTGIMASVKNGQWAKDMLEYYNGRAFLDRNNNPELISNVEIITSLMKDKGLELNNTHQEMKNYITFYPSDVFCPKSHETGLISLTKNTVCIHHFAGSWLTGKSKGKRKLSYFIANVFGAKTLKLLKKYLLNKK